MMRFRICLKRRASEKNRNRRKDERTSERETWRTEEQRLVERAWAGAHHAAREFDTRAHSSCVLLGVCGALGLKRKRRKRQRRGSGNAFCFRRAEPISLNVRFDAYG